MTLEDCCAPQFSRSNLLRGDDFYMRDHVDFKRFKNGVLNACVNGSRGREHDVTLDWSRAQSGTVAVSCSCPQFAEGEYCEHIWATIREAEYRDLPPLGLGEYGWQVSMSRMSPSGGAKSAGNGRGPRRGWMELVDSALVLHDGCDSAKSSDPIVGSRRQILYVLNVGRSTFERGLAVDLYFQKLKKNGQFGKARKLNLSHDEIQECGDPADREILELLINLEDNSEDRGYYSYYSESNVDRARIPAALYDSLLPRLCETGRFLWALESDVSMEDARPLTWDGGPPWRFELRIEADDNQERWDVGGRLIREGSEAPLTRPVLVTADGLVLMSDDEEGRADRLGHVDLGGNQRWFTVLRSTETLHVPYADRDVFLEKMISIGDLRNLETPENLQAELVDLAPRPKLTVLPPSRYGGTRELFATVQFGYGDRFFPVNDESPGSYDASTNTILVRDRRRETESLSVLWSLGVQPSERNPFTREERGDVRFRSNKLSEIVDRLVKSDWLVEAEGKLVRRPGKHKLSVKSDVDWFELDGRFDFDGVEASLPALLKALKQGEKYVVLDDGSQGMLPDDWLSKYGAFADLAEVEGDVLKFSNSQAALLDALLASQENVEVDGAFEQFRANLRAFSGVQPRTPPRTFKGTLRDYQRDGLGWLNFLREFRLGGCLADDMGLGKTIQVLALLEERRKRQVAQGETRRPSLVVVPRSLVFNWIEEAKRFTPRLSVVNYTGMERAAELERNPDHDCMVTTYGILRRDILKLKDQHFDYAILDEAQAVKNSGSQASKASRLIRADHRLVMTGTPVENHLEDLWSLFEFLNPGMLGASGAFQALSRSWSSDRSSLSVLSRALRPYILRRTKEQVLTDLPEKTEQTLYCEMSRDQRKMYDELRAYYRESLSKTVKSQGLQRSKIHVLEALLRLRQAACHPGLLDKKREGESSAKLDVLLDQIQEITDEGHKALVFSQFTSLLRIVRGHLDKRGLVYEYLDGRTRKRQEKVNRFQNDTECPLFLISLKAGGYGLNLTAADYVFMLDPWWNPAVEAQAIDRTHRIGQTRPVFAYRLICRDTVEDKILQLQNEKRDLADAIVSADNSLIRKLTADDLQLLLS